MGYLPKTTMYDSAAFDLSDATNSQQLIDFPSTFFDLPEQSSTPSQMDYFNAPTVSAEQCACHNFSISSQNSLLSDLDTKVKCLIQSQQGIEGQLQRLGSCQQSTHSQLAKLADR